MSLPPSTDFSGLDCLSSGTLVLDADGRIVFINPAAEALLGVSGALLVGEDAMQVFERSPELLNAIQTARSEQEVIIEYELDLVMGGHPPLRVGCSVSPLEKPAHAMLIEMRAADPQLRIARLERARLQQEANRELLRNLAHEIKNPLGGIRGAAQLLEHELPRESLREYTQVIIKESDRLQSLMERLLTPHRMPRFGAVNIHEVLERVRSLILAETPSVALRRDYDISLPEIHADSEQLIGFDSVNSDEIDASGDRLFFDERCFLRDQAGKGRFKLDNLAPVADKAVVAGSSDGGGALQDAAVDPGALLARITWL